MTKYAVECGRLKRLHPVSKILEVYVGDGKWQPHPGDTRVKAQRRGGLYLRAGRVRGAAGAGAAVRLNT